MSDNSLSTMSQLDLERLLHYEHSLAACYEAEYLLELSMQREHISGSENWVGYEDASEATSHHAPPLSSSPALTQAHRLAAERMDTVSSNNHHTAFLPRHAHTIRTPTESADSLQTPHVQPHSNITPASSQQINGFQPHFYKNSLFPMQAECNHTQTSLPGASVFPEFQFQNDAGVSSSGPCWSGSHMDGPQRKRMCLQRPEM